jgi:O-antigen ligase
MTQRLPRAAVIEAGKQFFGSARFGAALTLTIVGTAVSSLFITELIGWGGLLGALGIQVLLAAVSLLAKREQIEWHGLLPISLLMFVGWAAASVIWSEYQWVTLGSIIYFGAMTMLGIYVALVRDTIQIARAFGDVLRVVLALSLALEILSGLLIDMPLKFLNIAGNLAQLGPIQGIFGTRNLLGIVVLVAIVTFGTEWRTKSVPRPVSISSLVIAGICLVLARSPIATGALVIVGLAAVALYGLRRVPHAHRRFWQSGLLAFTIVVAVLAWVYRTPIINALSASAELNTRLRLWRLVRPLIDENSLQGWGWTGHWRKDVGPFDQLTSLAQPVQASALNAYLDVWFQLGLIGLLLFLLMLGLAFVRSWLLASRQRSIVYAWPALVLVVLITTALAESAVLVEFGWLTFVVCCVKAARELSWRKAFAATEPTNPADQS